MGCDTALPVAEPPAQPLTSAAEIVEPGPPPRPLPPRGTGIPLQRPRPEARPVAAAPLSRGLPTPAAAVPQAPAPAPPAGRADVTLDFENADIRDVVGVVLRDILKRNYVIDPDVTGTVTLKIVDPITQEAALPALEATLNTIGARLTQVDGVLRVTKSAGTPRLGGRALPGGQVGVFPLRHIAPSEAQRVLEPLLGEGKIAAADDARGILVVRGDAQEQALARDTLRLFDTDSLAGMSAAMVLLENAPAAATIRELDSLFGAARKANEPGVIRFVPIERLNAILVLSRVPRYIEEAQTWIRRLDTVRPASEPKLYVYFVQHGKSGQVARTLQNAFSRSAPTAEPAAEPVEVSALPPASPAAGLAGVPAGVITSDTDPAARAAPAAARRAEAPPLPAPGPEAGTPRIQPDETNNSLLIYGTQREYEQVLQVLEQIDIPPLQVMIEATIAEVVLRNQLRYGVEYFITSGNFAAVLSNSGIPTGIVPRLPGAAAIFAPNGTPQVILEALSQITQTNVISTPRLLVLDNQSARLQVGDVVPIVTQSAVSTLTSTAVTVNSVQYRDTGVIIEVQPRVNASGFITLDIAQSVSDVVRTTTSNIDSPTIRQRRIRSSIGVQDGSTIMLGGLISDDAAKSNSGIPVLHEIPIIGALFGTKEDSRGRTELVVLLTPRVVRNPQEARDMTIELGRKFSGLVAAMNEGRSMPRPAKW